MIFSYNLTYFCKILVKALKMTLHIFFQELIEMAKKDLERNKAEQKRKSSRAKTNVDEDKVDNFYQLKNLAVL